MSQEPKLTNLKRTQLKTELPDIYIDCIKDRGNKRELLFPPLSTKENDKNDFIKQKQIFPGTDGVHPGIYRVALAGKSY